MNSSDLLERIEAISAAAGKNIEIDVHLLARDCGIGVNKLMAILTELEKRDRVILELDAAKLSSNEEVSYTGTVRLMDDPTEELRGNE